MNLDELEALAKAATPGPYEARCREFSNHAPLELWSEFGWVYNLPRPYREPTTIFQAALSPDVVLNLIARIRALEKAGVGK